MFIKISGTVTYIKEQSIIMHLLFDKDFKIEDDYSNYIGKKLLETNKKHIF